MAEQNTGLFTRLKRLFSTDVVIRNVGGNQLRTVDVDRIQAYGNVKTNALIDRFTKLHRYGANMPYNPTMNYQTLRIQLYTDYEAMDTESIVASALDIVADEATLKNEAGEVLQIRSSDENVQRILYNLFYDVLNVEFNLWLWIRNMCKYGDFYLHLEIAEKFGVYNVTPLSVYDMLREEGQDPNNPSNRNIEGIYSPGTFFNAESTEISNNSMCIWIEHVSYMKNKSIVVGISNIDIYTGRVIMFEYKTEDKHNPTSYDELERYISTYKPSEIIMITNFTEKILDDIINYTGIICKNIPKFLFHLLLFYLF